MAKSFAFLFRATNPIIRLLVGRDNLVLLTDSEILSTSLPNYYKSPVHLVPIPHTPAHRRDILENQKSRDDVVCWWPGAPRAEKGADAIRRLVTVKDRNADKVTLVAAKSAGMTGVAGGIRVEMVDDKLDRDEYERRFFTSDLILLPYDRDIYGESTSGIFVESMVAGATPLVTKGTWMAYELEKRNLGELAIDWESDSIVQQIISIATSQSIKQKTEMMGLEYRSFHNIPFFAQVLNSLYRMMSSP